MVIVEIVSSKKYHVEFTLSRDALTKQEIKAGLGVRNLE